MNKFKKNVFFNFFKKYKNILLLCLLINITIYIVLYYKNNYKNYSLHKISINYEKLINLKITNKNINNILFFIKTNHNNYGIITSLIVMKYYIQQNELKNAINILINNLKYVKDSNFKSIMIIHLARLQLEDHQINESIRTLKKIKSYLWMNIIYDIHGDLLFNIGNIHQARNMWLKGIYSNKSLIIPLKKTLKMKINNVSYK